MCARKEIRIFVCEIPKEVRIIAQQSRRGHLINREITFPEVRLVAEDGEMIGGCALEEALSRAEAAELDLVLMSPNKENPVAKLMDYGKYTFDLDKKKREAKKHQKTIQVKEVQIKLTTEEHDFNVKVRNAVRFLENGDRVKVVIRFRGREMAFRDQGFDVMRKVADAVSEVGVVDKAPQSEGRNMIMYLAPITEK